MIDITYSHLESYHKIRVEMRSYMNLGYGLNQTDNGPNPYVANIEQQAVQNQNFRTAIWTGCHLQMTLMCIPPCGEVGLEIHPDTDQFIRVEQGNAVVGMGKWREGQPIERNQMQKGPDIKEIVRLLRHKMPDEWLTFVYQM